LSGTVYGIQLAVVTVFGIIYDVFIVAVIGIIYDVFIIAVIGMMIRDFLMKKYTIVLIEKINAKKNKQFNLEHLRRLLPFIFEH